MANKAYAVLSKPPEGISWDEYNQWYHHHARENAETPYFRNVQRYRVRPVVVGAGVGSKNSSIETGTTMYEHLAVFQFDGGSIEDVRAHLNGRVESGEIALPEWFMRVPFSTWSCEPLEELYIPEHAK